MTDKRESWNPGDTVGGFALVARLPEAGGTAWVVRCLSCSAWLVRLNPFAAAEDGTCSDCAKQKQRVTRTLDFRCRYCAETRPEKKKTATCCKRCERRKNRNGLCPMCSAILHGTGRGGYCVCGWRPSFPEDVQVKRAVEALLGIHMAPTYQLLRDITDLSQSRIANAIGETACRMPALSPKAEQEQPAEARVSVTGLYTGLVARWRAGESIRELATEVGRSHNTLRWHFGRHGGKTGLTARKTRKAARKK